MKHPQFTHLVRVSADKAFLILLSKKQVQ